ncbi:hypothetical protein N7474_009700 [Penicillium riverlandense]|uniref:uncharacterized protein n=1 Tax=Penicillium riverlandense TaxID=1903569 RepID=UPI00254870D4|nr:uncharacterized protein N7474_009700 [Penicillium riverlandense]KAJ5808431.1 hypothetical protein N7474_009700 [Penicillium riverlandense]
MATTTSRNSSDADHLCVLVHGLWGNPSHLDYVASELKKRHGEDHLHVLCAKGNSGNLTYDGIETGGERLAHEIEQTLDDLSSKGQEIKKLSVVGYSLGGLVARYAIGLLHARGWLDKLEPVNFTTFASPHVGVRMPLKGITNTVFNVMGPRTISVSGHQLFLVDSFRDTGRPLLSVLADPESIFIKGLAKFQHRAVYANIRNDRSVIFYTAALSTVDPFRDLESMNINYVEGYEQVIIDPDVHVLPPAKKEPESLMSRIWNRTKSLLIWIPLSTLILLLLPLALTIFLINALIQTFRSQQRIRRHGEGKNGVLFGPYKVPVLVQNVQHAVEEVFENVNARQEPAYQAAEKTTLHGPRPGSSAQSNTDTASASASVDGSTICPPPTLALTAEQFEIIESLNTVGFRKYPVHIHKHRHTHAAIIFRIPKDGHAEGKLVIKHWLDNEFVV